MNRKIVSSIGEGGTTVSSRSSDVFSSTSEFEEISLVIPRQILQDGRGWKIVLSVGEIWDGSSSVWKRGGREEGGLFLFVASVSSFSRVQIAFSTSDYPTYSTDS